jgi:hypothetical protein
MLHRGLRLGVGESFSVLAVAPSEKLRPKKSPDPFCPAGREYWLSDIDEKGYHGACMAVEAASSMAKKVSFTLMFPGLLL